MISLMDWMSLFAQTSECGPKESLSSLIAPCDQFDSLILCEYFLAQGCFFEFTNAKAQHKLGTSQLTQETYTKINEMTSISTADALFLKTFSGQSDFGGFDQHAATKTTYQRKPENLKQTSKRNRDNGKTWEHPFRPFSHLSTYLKYGNLSLTQQEDTATQP